MHMKKTKMAIDALMVIALPLLMAYSLIGENVHEVIGIGMFVLFVAHHVINRKWWKTLFIGRYNAPKILITTVNLFLAIYMLLQPISGVLMSKYVLKQVTIRGASATLRTIHMTMAYWGFLLMGLHLGMHIWTIMATLKLHVSKRAKIAWTVVVLLISGYGVYAFIKRGIGDYLLMRVMFAFFDFNESKIWFMLDYAAVIVLMACLGHYLLSVLLHMQKRKKGFKKPK